MFLLVPQTLPRTFAALKNFLAIGRVNRSIADVCVALRPHDVFGNVLGTLRHVSALAEHFVTVSIGVFDEMVVENLTMIHPISQQPPAHALSRCRVVVHQPVDHIQVVDVLFDDVITAQPIEVIPVSHLIGQFRITRLPRSLPDAVTIPIHATVKQIADDSVLQLLNRLLIGPLVSTLQTDLHQQILRAGLFAILQHLANPRRVDRNGLLHEHVLTGLNGGFEMQRTKTGWRCQDDQIGIRVHDRFIGVQTNVGCVFVDSHFFAMFGLRLLQRRRHAIGKHVPHGNQFHIAAGRVHRLNRSPRTASSTTDQSNLHRVRPCRMSRFCQR